MSLFIVIVVSFLVGNIVPTFKIFVGVQKYFWSLTDRKRQEHNHWEQEYERNKEVLKSLENVKQYGTSNTAFDNYYVIMPECIESVETAIDKTSDEFKKSLGAMTKINSVNHEKTILKKDFESLMQFYQDKVDKSKNNMNKYN